MSLVPSKITISRRKEVFFHGLSQREVFEPACIGMIVLRKAIVSGQWSLACFRLAALPRNAKTSADSAWHRPEKPRQLLRPA